MPYHLLAQMYAYREIQLIQSLLKHIHSRAIQTLDEPIMIVPHGLLLLDSIKLILTVQRLKNRVSNHRRRVGSPKHVLLPTPFIPCQTHEQRNQTHVPSFRPAVSLMPFESTKLTLPFATPRKPLDLPPSFLKKPYFTQHL